MTETTIELTSLSYPSDPARVVRVRVERPVEQGDGPRPVVLILHGFKGFMHWGFFPELSRRLAEAGLVAVSLNASGSGVGEDLENFTEDEAFAKDTYSKELEDLELVRSFAETLPGVASDRMAVFGHSRGGGRVLLLASPRGGYRAVVTWASIDDVKRWDAQTMAEWQERGFVLIPNARTGQEHRLDLDLLRDAQEHGSALDIQAACRRLETPTLVVHGTADPAVEVAAAERLIEALPSATYLCIENAGHTFGATHPFTSPTPELEAVLGATRDFLLGHL